MKNLTLHTVAAACGGTYYGPAEIADQEITAITTDSRVIEKGCLFVPIKGERADGHDYIPQVMGAGALGTLSQHPLEDPSIPYIQVPSSLQAVKDIAAYYLDHLEIPVIGITGSVGKTSTKEMIASVLAQKYNVLKTLGNFNNELGLPLTVFRLRPEHEIAVLEMGISDFGEMSRLAAIAKPNVCVITNIGQCHLENLGDRNGVLKAKTEIFEYLKEDGIAILNGDDDKLSTIDQVYGRPPVFFGLDSKFAIYADDIQSLGLKGIACTIHTTGGSFAVQIPIPGQHMVYNALAGTAVGLTYGLSLEQIKQGIESLQALTGRFHIIEDDNYTIIDDCYNANPVSMKASLGVLKDGLGRRIAILGDMGELGANEEQLHYEVGVYAADLGLDGFICVGALTKHLVAGIRSVDQQVPVTHMDSLDQLLPQLKSLLQTGDTLLVKASHFMQFERILKELVN